MIVDAVSLTGKRAYLVDAASEVNLMQAVDRTGGFGIARAGMTVEIAGLHIVIVGDDLPAQLPRGDEALFSIAIRKELFPGLFGDPYAARVHTIAGHDDFSRGALDGAAVVDVEGVPTLVSTGSDAVKWVSPMYRLPDRATFNAAAWELASSKLTPRDGFDYSLSFEGWPEGTSLNAPASVAFPIVTSVRPDRKRCDDLPDEAVDLIAYRVTFTARVRTDAYMRERLVGSGGEQSTGRPLLRSISLVEQRPPTYRIASLSELIGKSSQYEFVRDGDGRPSMIYAGMDLSVVLREGEEISLRVNHPDYERFEARLDASVQIRPPVTDKPR